jgi:chromosomal replication initiator protein
MICDPKVWQGALSRLQEEIPDFVFEAWIQPLTVKLGEDRIVLGCPSSFHRDRVRIQFRERLAHHLDEALRSEVALDAAPELESSTTRTPVIDLVCLPEFAEASGLEIELAHFVSREEQQIEERERTILRVSSERVSSARVSGQRVSLQASAQASAAATGSSMGSVRPTARSTTAERVPALTPVHESPAAPRPSPRATRAAAKASKRKPQSAGQPTDQPISQPELPFSFESFIVGPCNALAREAALALARTRQRSLNMLYLGGESGMGKTHLARATAAESRRHGSASTEGFGAPSAPRTRSSVGPARGVLFTSAEQFTSEFVSAMRNGRGEDFKRRYRAPIGLLVVEDIQYFSGRVKTQLELFHTVQHCLDAGGRVLLTGDRSPRQLTGLDERVRAQVGQGFVAELEPPDAIVRRHILRSKAAAGGVRLPDDCLDRLVEASHGSVRDIESMLIQVVTTASLLGRSIDLALTDDAIALKASTHSAIPAKKVAVSEIVRIVSAFFGKRPEALASKSRRRDVLVPRQLAMYLAHRYTEASFAEIGRGLGRGHPSVRNAIERVERQVLENAPLRYQVEALSERIDSTLKNSD